MMKKINTLLLTIKNINLRIIFMLLIIIFNPVTCFATSNTDFYSANDILFYNPNDGCATTSSASNMTSTSSGYDRLKEATRTYGELAMEMEREYGVPWEVVIAQMQKESNVGTAGAAVNGANNNWLGINGTGDAGSYGRYAVYSSVEASIKAWAGTQVLRSGPYDKAFQYLDPNNYDLEGFLTSMISVYAPDSDGNNGASYLSDVLSFINGPISEVRTDKGWPSSAELAKKENIAIGGKNALGSSISSTTSDSSSSINCSTASITGNKIVDTAISLVYKDGDTTDRAARTDQNKNLVYLNTAYLNAANWSNDDMYTDCGRFVGTVMRTSGADTDYPEVGTSTMLNYVKSSDKYNIISFTGDISVLQPGDILIRDGHTALWLGLNDDNKKVAQASLYTDYPEFKGSSSAADFANYSDPIIARLK